MARKKTTMGAAALVAARVNSQMKGNLLTMASDDKFKLTRVPTGILSIDRLTGGGFARGRSHELYGDFSAGKSLIIYNTLARAQERGEVCAIVDAERVFNDEWFRSLGGDPSSLIAYRPTTAEELAAVLQLFVQKSDEVKGLDIVGVDSVATLLPREELEHDIQDGDDRVASLARLMSRLLRRVTSQNDDTTFLWANQWRDKISRIPGQKSTPGGRALGFYASTRIELLMMEKETTERDQVRKGAKSKRKVVIGQWVKAKATKDKTKIPQQEVSFMFDLERKCIDVAREIIDLGMTDGLIERHGDNYMLPGIGSGPDSMTKHHGIKRTVDKIVGDEELRDFLISCIEERTAELAGLDG